MRKTLTLTLGAVAAITLTACGTDTSDSDKPAPTPSELADEQRASIRAEAGLPDPTDEQQKAFVDALNAIKADIAHGKPDKAVSRGINQCGSIKRGYGDTKLTELANGRFISPDAPEGHGLDIAKQINAAAHKHLCPDY